MNQCEDMAELLLLLASAMQLQPIDSIREDDDMLHQQLWSKSSQFHLRDRESLLGLGWVGLWGSGNKGGV